MNDERILLLNNHQIDKSRWDETIDRSPNGLIYGYSWYLDIVSPNWYGLVSEGYKAIMPLTWRKKFGFEYLFPPFFTQQLGVFSRKPVTNELVGAFISKIPSRYKFIDINLNSENKLLPEGFRFSNNFNYTLKLSNTYNQIQSAYSQNLKRNLKKAQQYQLTIVGMKEAEALIDLFRKNRGKTIKNFRDKEYELLSELIGAALERKMCEIYYAYYQNRLVAGAVFMKTRSRIIFLFSATNAEGKNLLAMPALIDRYISMHQQRDLIFDFEGSNNKELARFYSSFGASESTYLKIKRNNLPLPLRLLKK